MNLKLITAAVLALVAVVPAHADINPGSTSPGNGELFLSIWDNNGTLDNAADDRSYTRDLGIFMNSFASAVTLPVAVAPQPTYSFAADATLTSWLATANAANLFWNVVGVESFGKDRFLSTASLGFTGSNLTSGNQSAAVLNVQTYLGQVNAAMPGTVADNASVTFVAADTGFAGDATFGTNFGGGIDFNNAGGIGDNLAFWMVSEGSTSLTPAQNLELANQWNLAANGTLTYAAATAPIPEADTYALMLAGLGLVGFIARRRKAV